MGGPLLRVVDLGVAYRSAVALDGVSLEVVAGAAVTVCGPNGAGKSSLLRAVSGLLGLHGGRVTAGRVDVGGWCESPSSAADRPVRSEPASQRCWSGVGRPLRRAAPIANHTSLLAGGPVGHVLEGRRVFAELTVEENLRTGAFTLARAARAPAVAGVLERFPQLAARRTVRAGHLSGGEQQLLVIARALVPSPPVLLLDEPTVGLARATVELVAAVLGESGAAVVVAEQAPVLFPEADVVQLERGRVVPVTAPV